MVARELDLGSHTVCGSCHTAPESLRSPSPMQLQATVGVVVVRPHVARTAKQNETQTRRRAFFSHVVARGCNACARSWGSPLTLGVPWAAAAAAAAGACRESAERAHRPPTCPPCSVLSAHLRCGTAAALHSRQGHMDVCPSNFNFYGCFSYSLQ